MFIGPDCMVKFLEFLKEINDTFLEVIANLEDYEMTPLTLEDEQKHQESNTCVICGRDGFCDNNYCKGCWNCFYLGGKVHHHNHLSSEYNYIGSAHFKCNINIRKDKFITPVFALCNFSYDFEHVLEGLGQSSIDWKLKPICTK